MHHQEPWAEIGRRLRQALAGRSKTERLDLLRAEARALGKAPHTLQRYLRLLAFYEDMKLTERDIDHLPIAHSEVILRLHEVSKTAALQALADLKRGRLTYQQVLARMRDMQPVKEQSGRSALSARVATRILTTLGIDETAALVALEARSCTPYLSDPNIIYRVGERRLAILSETMLQHKAKRGLRLFVREAIVAAAEFDAVVTLFSASRSLARFEALTHHLLPSVKDRLRPLLMEDT